MALIDRISTAVLMAFWERIEKQEKGWDGPCWIWTGATSPGKNGNAYGYVRWAVHGGSGRSHLYAHRVAYVLANGLDLSDIDGKDIHHKCGYSLCVNPKHHKSLTVSGHAKMSNIARWEEEKAWQETVEAQEATRQPFGYPDPPQPDCGK